MAKLLFKIFPPSQSFHGVDYSERKQKEKNARLVYFDNFGHLQQKTVISGEEFKDYLSLYSKRNKRVKQPQFHAVLSCKGKELDSGQLKDYAVEIMNRLGYAGNPVLIYEHTDTANRHIHIVSSRVDKNGKKINDSFERKRANNILSEILLLSTEEQCARDLAASFLYRYSTEKQFLLLMELKGYRTKFNAQTKQFDFYKHGAMQGSVLRKDITGRIQAGNLPDANRKKMAAILHYYQDKYSVEPIANTAKKPYPRQPFETALTNHLKKTFGWEFVFFKNGDHSQPYGYVVIDHRNHHVYKGSELMKLQELLSTDKSVSADTVKTEAAGIENKAVLQFDFAGDEAEYPSAAPMPTPVFSTDNTGIPDNSSPFASMAVINELGNKEMAEADNLSHVSKKPSKSKKRVKY